MGMAIVLVGTHEIRVRLGGISRQRVDQITKKPSFPKPLAELAQGRVWLADDVAAWLKTHRPESD
jgi:prophage regulatory protein